MWTKSVGLKEGLLGGRHRNPGRKKKLKHTEGLKLSEWNRHPKLLDLHHSFLNSATTRDMFSQEREKKKHTISVHTTISAVSDFKLFYVKGFSMKRGAHNTTITKYEIKSPRDTSRTPQACDTSGTLYTKHICFEQAAEENVAPGAQNHTFL